MREHTDLRNQLADQEVERRPQWTRDALGERPERASAAESWDQAARTHARYRIEYEITEDRDWLEARPADPQQRHDHDRAVRARDQLAHHLEREAPPTSWTSTGERQAIAVCHEAPCPRGAAWRRIDRLTQPHE